MKRRFTRTLSLMLAVLTILSTAIIFPITSSAESEELYTYTVTNGEAEITGCDYNISGDITIPSTLGGYPVTSIGAYVFYNCSSLTSVTIPEKVTSIGERAFQQCSSLTSIAVDAGNASYSSENGILFNKDKSVLICYPAGISNTEYIIPGSVTSIGNAAFGFCISLTSITIPNSVTTIGKETFFYCTSFTGITIPDSVTSIGDGAFEFCTSLTGITLSDSVTSIGRHMFYECTSLTGITIPRSVTSIGSEAFYDCNLITSIIIPDSVTSIGNDAFSNCTSLTAITLPDSVTSIGSSAFSYTAYYNNTANRENGVLYIGNHLIKVIDSSFEEYIVKAGTKTIASTAFVGYTALTGITIPDSVTSICFGAFLNCASLTNITIPDSVTSIGDYAFSGCTSLTIHGYKNSAAHRYAAENSVNFERIICAEHTPGGYIIKKFSTEDEEGEKIRICSVCSEELEAPIPIPKLSVWVNNFPDVSDGSWYLEALCFASTMGMIKGLDDGTFSPGANMTRGMLVTMLGRLSGVSDGEYPSNKPFGDVETNAWYAPYVAWAKTTGVVGDYPGGTFAPDKTITRQEMAKMFANYAKIYDGKDITTGLDEGKYASFIDVSSVADWAKAEMLWATSAGLINGMPVDGGYALNPAATATRAEVAQILYNYCTEVS